MLSAQRQQLGFCDQLRAYLHKPLVILALRRTALKWPLLLCTVVLCCFKHSKTASIADCGFTAHICTCAPLPRAATRSHSRQPNMFFPRTHHSAARSASGGAGCHQRCYP